MKRTWRYIESRECDADINMSVDEAMATSVLQNKHQATLRIYSWKRPSVTIGMYQKLADINVALCMKKSVPIVRRPTGGRAILHGNEITYSFVGSKNDHKSFANLLSSYALLSRVFLTAFRHAGIDAEVKTRCERGRVLSRNPCCFNTISFGEISVKGYKVIGSAQKRYRNGFLQQGSIPLLINRLLYREIFHDDQEAMGLCEIYPSMTSEHIQRSIRKSFENIFEARFIKGDLTADESSLALYLLERKYRSSEWTSRRP